MNLEYRGDTRIKHERVQPPKPNFCRLSIIANIINFFRGRTVFTPQIILDIINHERLLTGIAAIDLDEETISDEESKKFIKMYGNEVGSVDLEGGRYLNRALWDELIASGFIIAPDHQMLYSDPINLLKNELFYLPPDLVDRLVSQIEFNYQTFLDLYSFFIARAGQLDEGHMDMVLDLRDINGVDSIVLANLASKGNEYPLAVPWNLFRNYLCLDWFGAAIYNIDELPDEAGMRKLMAEGTQEHRGRDFFHASLEVYYPKDKKKLLDEIVKKYV